MGAGSRGSTAPFPRTCYELRYAAKRERIRARIARINFLHWMDETYSRWECVHLNEGAWNDDGAPYYGGLQFDWNYMAAYGPGFLRKWGHAGRWPVWAQLIAAERGRQAAGWHPWPNTARECGLSVSGGTSTAERLPQHVIGEDHRLRPGRDSYQRGRSLAFVGIGRSMRRTLTA